MSGRVVLLMSLLAFAAAPLAAQQETVGGSQGWLSGNVAVASDYTFRGVSQTLEEPAIQGGLDLQTPSGVYLGTWGSNVNFGEELSAGARAQVELDVYGGIARNLGGVLDVDLGFIYYAYPGAASGFSYDFLEWGLGASRTVRGAGLGASLKYSPDFFGGSGPAVYYGGELEVPVSPLTLSGSVGRQTIRDNDVFGLPDYIDWSAGAAVGVMGVELGAKVVGTNLSRAECFAGGSELCQARVVLSVSRGM